MNRWRLGLGILVVLVMTTGWARAESDCTIIYGSSSHNAIDWAKPAILASGCFAQVPAGEMPFYFDAVRSVRFAVFRAVTPA